MWPQTKEHLEPLEGGRDKEGLSPGSLEGRRPCWCLDLDLASRTERELNFTCLSHWVYVICEGSSRNLTVARGCSGRLFPEPLSLPLTVPPTLHCSHAWDRGLRPPPTSWILLWMSALCREKVGLQAWKGLSGKQTWATGAPRLLSWTQLWGGAAVQAAEELRMARPPGVVKR